MIPRLKPYLGWAEILTLFKNRKSAVDRFEHAFAGQFHTKHAIAFPYGRSALWAFMRAMKIENAEVVQPAYTCSVVAHATVLSGNIPVFVDCNLTDYNMDIAQFADAITADTRVVIPTHIFGYPMDVDAVNNIVADAEKKFGQKIWVIQDCAHSFDAEFNGKPVINAGDGAIFGLGISKQITSIFGGMFTTDDELLAEKLRAFRNVEFDNPGWIKGLKRYLYLLAVYPALTPAFYGLVYWLQEKTPFLNRLTKAYHLDEVIHFPPDYLDQMTDIEALVGLEQVKKYVKIARRRKAIANDYFENIPADDRYVFPPQVEGATYSHFAVRTKKRDDTMAYFATQGIQLGQLIEYCMPHLPVYKPYTNGREFPNALNCSESMINLPIHPGLKKRDTEKITFTYQRCLRNEE